MKAAVFESPGKLQVVDIISVGACGIYATDLHWIEHRDTSGGWRELVAGGVLGHDFARGIVEARIERPDVGGRRYTEAGTLIHAFGRQCRGRERHGLLNMADEVSALCASLCAAVA